MNKRDVLFLFLTIISLAVVLVTDIITPPQLILASLYTIPILICAYHFGPKIISVVTFFVIIIFSTHTLYTENITLINIFFQDIGFLIVAFLAMQFSLQRKKNEESLWHLQLFINMISHDLVQPITAAKLYVQILRKYPDRNVRLKAAKIATPLHYLQKLIFDLKDIVQARSGEFSVYPAEMDLCRLLSDVVEEQQRNDKKHTIILRIPKKIIGKWDRGRLNQVLTNLISNAIKYSEKGIITVSAKQKRRVVLVSVADKGPGIPENQQQLIFTPFKRLEQNRNIGGSGLGLYICKLIVEGHQGRIWVESTKNRGSTFFFTLPRTSR